MGALTAGRWARSVVRARAAGRKAGLPLRTDLCPQVFETDQCVEALEPVVAARTAQPQVLRAVEHMYSEMLVPDCTRPEGWGEARVAAPGAVSLFVEAGSMKPVPALEAAVEQTQAVLNLAAAGLLAAGKVPTHVRQAHSSAAAYPAHDLAAMVVVEHK